MEPFGVDTVTPYVALSTGPRDLASPEYAAAFNEVKALGDTNDPDPTRTAIARHWQAEANTARETGLWFKAALDVVERWGTVFSLSLTARLFALLGMGIADAVTTSWNAKFDFRFWRPGDAIREAATDGNPDTEPDESWTPRNGAFGATPKYTSGTSTFAGAASTILAGFYCVDRVPFMFEGELGTPAREYRSFSQAADEAGRSRIFNGTSSSATKMGGAPETQPGKRSSPLACAGQARASASSVRVRSGSRSAWLDTKVWLGGETTGP
jgi:hypothetical protein